MKFVDSTFNRSSVWEGALRSFKRSSFDPRKTIFVNFADGAGIDEGAVDSGGPKREFLRLLMWHSGMWSRSRRLGLETVSRPIEGLVSVSSRACRQTSRSRLGS